MADFDSSRGSSPLSSDVATRTAAVPTKPSPARLSRKQAREIERATLAADRPRLRPLRAVGTVVAIAALIGGVAIPAYAVAMPQLTGAPTVLEAAQAEAQVVEVDANAQSQSLTSASYSATTREEIEEAEAAAAAAQARLEEQQKLLAQQQQQSGDDNTTSQTQPEYSPSVPVDGLVNPLPAGSYSLGDGIEATYRNHQGQDMLAPANTPIYAVAAGTVSTSGYSGGYGNAVYIQHSVNGTAVETRYGHMISAPVVGAGQTVEAGQLIGYVGSTGRSTANHLHIEVRVNGAVVDPRSYLPI